MNHRSRSTVPCGMLSTVGLSALILVAQGCAQSIEQRSGAGFNRYFGMCYDF